VPFLLDPSVLIVFGSNISNQLIIGSEMFYDAE